MTKILVSASILSADFGRLAQQLAECESAGVDWIHIDVMDGAFVPNITMGPFIVETCKRLTRLPLDVHLMINHPEKHIAAFADSGANVISIHIENNPNVFRTLQTIREKGCKAGIVLNPGTPASAIETLIPEVDLALVMTVNPGFSGQKYIPSVLPKIKAVRGLIDSAKSNALLEVDGGITAQTLPETVAAGAQVFVTATAVFKHPQGIASGLRALREAAA